MVLSWPGFLAGIAGLGMLLCSDGCGTSHWEAEFRPAGGTAPALAAAEPVRIREVSFERVQTTLRALSDEAAGSDVHPEDWPREKQDQAHAELLRGLQVSGDPARVRVLGRSEFCTTDQIRPDDGTLERFARKIGATTVVWSSAYRGKTDVIVDEPVQEWRTATLMGRSGRVVTYNESTTVWVPVRMQADQRAFVAFFLRGD